MEKENPGTWHRKRLDKRRQISDESSKKVGAINLLEENSSLNDPCIFTTAAPSNFLILANIFHHLSGEDLESSNLVNKLWNDVLGQVYGRHCEVRIKPAQHKLGNPGCEKTITEENHVTIQKLCWSSKRSHKKKFSFPEAVKFLLQESSKERKFTIANFKPKCIEDREVEDLFGKIGHLVRGFTPYSHKAQFLDPLCRLSQQYFPNLCYLNLSHVKIIFGAHCWKDFNEFLRKNPLCNLRKICFGQSLEHFENVDSFIKAAESIIEMAPNLKEIHAFPIQLVDALFSTGKSNLVKSVCYPYNRLIGEHAMDGIELYGYILEIANGGPLEVALRKFAQLEPKLISFSFSLYKDFFQWIGNADYPYPSDYFYHEYLKTPICQILQSSHKSLETLTLHPPASFDFQAISPMTSLKTIQFMCRQNFDDFVSLAKNVNLERVFPNVSVVEIVIYYWYDIDKLAPLKLVPWGSKIKELVLVGRFQLNSNTIPPLADSFPCVKKLKFLGYSRISPDTLMVIFPLIADSWPEVEAITFKMKGESTKYQGYHGYSFDSMFTGIPKMYLSQLKTPKGRKKIPKKKLEAFYANSTIRKLSSVDLKKIQEDLANVVALEFETIQLD